MAHTPTYWRVRFMLAAGTLMSSIPVDLTSRLTAEGYDLSEVERRHGQ